MKFKTEYILRYSSNVVLFLILTITSAYAASSEITMKDAVDIALMNSPMITSSIATSESMKSKAKAVSAMNGFQVSAIAMSSTGSMPAILNSPNLVVPQIFSDVPDKSRIALNFMAMFPVYTYGKTFSQKNAADALYYSSRYDIENLKLDISLAVKDGYYKVILAKESVGVFQNKVDESQERLRIAELSYKEGKIAKYDLLRNSAELADSQIELNNANLELESAYIELKNIMGLSQNDDIIINDKFEFDAFDINTAKLTEEALQKRPNILTAQAKVKWAKENVIFAKSAYYPQIYATAMQEFSKVRGLDSENGYIIGVIASVPIVDSGLRKSSVDDAGSTLKQMKADESRVVLEIEKNLKLANARLKTAKSNVELSRSSVEQAKENYSVIKLRYESGKAANVEVLDALYSFTKAKLNLTKALYDFNFSREYLNWAAGVE